MPQPIRRSRNLRATCSKLGLTATVLRTLTRFARACTGALSSAALLGFSSLSTVSHAAPPLTHCTDPGGVLSNVNQTCTFTVTTAGDSIDTSNATLYVPLAGSLRAADDF